MKAVQIDFLHSCEMDRDTGLNPGGRKWNMRFYRHNTAEMMGQDYYITALFLICIAIAGEIGMFQLLGLWWLYIQLIIVSVGVYFFVISDIKYRARIRRFALRMNKKYGIPMDQAIAYWYKNEEFLN